MFSESMFLGSTPHPSDSDSLSLGRAPFLTSFPMIEEDGLRDILSDHELQGG